jgi:hypothetical protein
MAKCPVCNHTLEIPFLLNQQGWSQLGCDDCGARLEKSAPRSARVIPFLSIPFVAARVLLVERHDHGLEIAAIGFCLATAIVLLVESVHPGLRLRGSS